MEGQSIGPCGYLLRCLWLGACVAFLPLVLLQENVEPEAWWLMVFLSFPSGYLLMGALATVASLAQLFGLDAFPVVNALAWPAMTVVGYLQWFVLIPMGWRWLRRRS